MSNKVHSRGRGGLFDWMTETGPFQSPVVKRTIFCFTIVNYFLCSVSFTVSYSEK